MLHCFGGSGHVHLVSLKGSILELSHHAVNKPRTLGRPLQVVRSTASIHLKMPPDHTSSHRLSFPNLQALLDEDPMLWSWGKPSPGPFLDSWPRESKSRRSHPFMSLTWGMVCFFVCSLGFCSGRKLSGSNARLKINFLILFYKEHLSWHLQFKVCLYS